jgi:cellulose synthase/poly-beta-1,6-N-acetylglucosamine synthase-like glycosyltransferase
MNIQNISVKRPIKGVSTRSTLKINGWYDYKPEQGTKYFGINKKGKLQIDDRDLPIVIIGICFYNESAVELRRTLVSLADQVTELKDHAICQVLFVSDGHRQMSNDTKELFKHIFCTTTDHVKYWDNLMKSLDEYCKEVDEANEDERRGTPIENAKKKPPHLTYVIQKTSKKKSSRMSVQIPGSKDGKPRNLPLTLILKGSNRRKHNSQEWILDAFARQAVISKNEKRNSDSNRYIFMSDCGTLYDSQCLYRLVRYMESHPLCVGCTGRQRVMTAEEQDDVNERVFSVGKFFRIIQLADYEASYAIYTGAFSAAGCLPVLPGPCALFRYSGLLSKRKFRKLDPLEIELKKEITRQRRSNSLSLLESYEINKSEIHKSDANKNENTKSETDEVEKTVTIKVPESEFLEPVTIKHELLDHEITTQEILNQDFDLREIVISDGLSSTQSTPSPKSQLINIPDSYDNDPNADESEDSESEDVFSIPLAGYDRHVETALEHFSSIVATPPEATDLVVENVKLAEDRIPSYAIVTHGKRGAYTTWVDGAVFKFQAETELRSFVLQRRRWINGAFLCYVWNTLSNPHLILGSKHTLLRKLLIYVLYFTQLINYVLASISPAIFSSALFLSVVSLFAVEIYTAIVIIVIYTLLNLFFMWVHRYIIFVKPLFYLLVVVNAIGMCLIVSAYIKECIRWNFFPPGIDNIIIQWCTVSIMSIPFVMAAISLDFKSLGYLIIACIPYWLFLPTFVGSFTIYALSRLSDTTWGNRVSVAGSSFKGASQKQIADLQADLSSNASVALVFISLANIIVEFLTIYFRANTWFIVGCIMTVFATTIIQVMVSFIYFISKHISCNTCKQRYKIY